MQLSSFLQFLACLRTSSGRHALGPMLPRPARQEYCPQRYGAVARGRHQQPVPRSKGHTCAAAAVVVQHSQRLAARIPKDAHLAVPTSRRKHTAVRANGHICSASLGQVQHSTH